jgi:putative oxidoreductase
MTMTKFLGRYSEIFYALLRIVAGWCFLLHGTDKLFGWPGGGEPVPITSLYGLAGIIELVGGLLILLGLFASWAAFIASGEMAVAYWMAHVGGVEDFLFPLVNRGESAVLFCFLFLYVAAKGAGKLSVASALNKPGLS